MSRLAFRSSEKSPEESVSFVPTVSHHIVLEATVRPMGGNDYEATQVVEQGRILNQLRTSGKDIFEMNETREVQSAGTTLYQTTEMYGTSMSIENIIETMKPADLTLRVNFNRPGTHSNTTCMALSSETLTKLLKTKADATGNKIAELRVNVESSAKVPRHGAFYVAITQKGTQHYLSHIDYKIMTQYDKMYHE
tara:strand:- start:3202 stop:3783 length:582 start_codon:yes stop_codon:yes gene_type:complete